MRQKIKIGIIGDYERNRESHTATDEAILHAAKALSLETETFWLPTGSLNAESSLKALRDYDALWCAPGGPYISTQGALEAIRFAREHDRPYLGT